jgi:hypothetical protein
MTTKLQKRPVEPSEAEVLDREDVGPEVGQWYWVKGNKGLAELVGWGHGVHCLSPNPTILVNESDYDRDGKWLGCVVHVGSNYIKLEGVNYTARCHLDDFEAECELESNPDDFIDDRVKGHKDKVDQLMERVKAITAQLGVAPSPMLRGASETKALARVNASSTNMDEYKTALVKAKEEQLPELFKEIEHHNKAMDKWMTAKVIPLKAQAEGMKGSLEVIEGRIFNVELYAGLSEQVEQIAEGEPAELGTKIHLLQRRHYMDEECLVDYQAGGMDFDGIRSFDEWLCLPHNRDRILPFDRCIVAFRVRRHTKHREMANLRDFIHIVNMEAADKTTFLYVRNGQQMFRMTTKLDFGAKLFPDMERSKLDGGKLWAKKDYPTWKIITDNERQGMREEYEREAKEYRVKKRAYDSALKSPEALLRAKQKGLKKPDASCVDVEWPGYGWHHTDESQNYTPFNRDNVYYDDIAAKIKEDIDHHNRIALVLQGLLDRSPVLHPHPPWQIWTNEGFEAALELVYDESRALPAGPAPDFEAYRKKLNKSLKSGSITVGQDSAWEAYETEKECKRLDEDWRTRSDYRPEHFRPYGNPGPGVVARVLTFSRKSRKATFAWHRERQDQRRSDEGPIRTTFTCSAEHLLNIDAYKPGDFHIFFDDPRTRQDYLEWAPLLLEAEEYHAGNRKVSEPVEPEPKKPSTWSGRKRYQQMKRRKELMDKAVRLTEEITTKGGNTYDVGSLWRVTDGKGATFRIVGIDDGGQFLRGGEHRSVFGVGEECFMVDEAVPYPAKDNS